MAVQVEQISVGTTFTIAHDILTAIIHAWDPAAPNNDVQIYNPRGHASQANSSGGGGKKSLNAFFRDHIDRVFCLNKDPVGGIRKLINDMKEDFANRASGTMEPNRVIFFHGGSEFYRDLFIAESSYWLTGYKLGSMPDLLEMSTKGLNYCESFAVKQSETQTTPHSNLLASLCRCPHDVSVFACVQGEFQRVG